MRLGPVRTTGVLDWAHGSSDISGDAQALFTLSPSRWPWAPTNHSKMIAMRTTMDSAGRIVIPKKLRDEANIETGMELDIRCRDGQIEIQAAQMAMHMEWRDGFLVAVADGRMPVLTAELVATTLEELRNERGRVHGDGS